MIFNLTQDQLRYSVYFAPRGEQRLLNLGYQISQMYLSAKDLLIGIIGSPGSGKSLLVKGMFPGLELTNDDNGVNVRPLPLLDINGNLFFSPHTYHVDVRFEQAFTQLGELAAAIQKAVDLGKRVVVEHFELVAPLLKQSADLIVGIGEEVIVTRPNVFGPLPQDIADIVHISIRYRKMAHTAEDLSTMVLINEFGFESNTFYKHGDVHHGFVLQFMEPPRFDLEKVEKRVRELIRQNLEVSFVDDEHIKIGETLFRCTGPRIHVANTSEIEGFRLLDEIQYDRQSELYFVTGLVGKERFERLDDLNSIRLAPTDIIEQAGSNGH